MRPIVRLLLAGGLVVSAPWSLSAGAAAAGDGDGPPPAFSSGSDGPSSATLGGSQTTTQVTPGSNGSTGNDSSGSGIPTSNVLGGGLTAETSPLGSCDPALYPGGYSDTLALPAPCIQPTPGEPQAPVAPVAPVITVQMVTDAARVTAPTTPPNVEPGNRSFVNIPNNYWADVDTVQTSVTVLGRAIPLTWTPTGTTWSFGDGSTATGNGVEGAELGAPGAVEHAYARQGSYDITTTTTYDLSFVLPGQGAQTIALTSPPSPAVTLPVGEIATRVSYAR